MHPVRHRVMFDTNAGSDELGYWLGFDQSKLDLTAIGPALCEGLIVTIYMEGELEMDATLRFDESRFDAKAQEWWADPLPNSIRYLDGSQPL